MHGIPLFVLLGYSQGGLGRYKLVLIGRGSACLRMVSMS